MKRRNGIHERVLTYAFKPTDQLFADFNLTKEGLRPEWLVSNRLRYGQNTIQSDHQNTVFQCFKRSFLNPFSLILLVLAGVTLLTDILIPEGMDRNPATMALILLMLLIGGTIRFVQELRSLRSAGKLSGFFQLDTLVKRDGKWIENAASDLCVGDLVRLQAGERVPADIRLIQSSNLLVSQSVITGESAVVEKNADPLTQVDSISCSTLTNTVFMGCTILEGQATGVVLAVGKDTLCADFSNSPSTLTEGFNREANSIARLLLRFMAILVPAAFFASGLSSGNWATAFLSALSAAVGLVPEMLPLVISACLVKGVISMRRKQTIVKNTDAMHSFGSMDVLCVDKTGTLTQDRLLLEYYTDILGNESREVLGYAWLNGSANYSTHRDHLDQAICQYEQLDHWASYFQDLKEKHPVLDTFAFDSKRRLASVLIQDEDQSLLVVKGSLDAVCKRCSHAFYQGQLLPADQQALNSVHAITDEMMEDGMKVLALACKPLQKDHIEPQDETDLTLLGYLVFFDSPKQSARSAIARLKQQNVAIKVLTGDQLATSQSVCARLDIETSHPVTGFQLDQMDQDDYVLHLENASLFAELTPQQKAKIVRTLQSSGHQVGYLGDGMNDLPALGESDVGISIDTADRLVRDSADVLLLRKDLNVLESGITEGRKAFANVMKYITITASSNFGNILSLVIASALLPFSPVTSLQILLLNVLYDTICLVLPWDNTDREACEHPLNWSGKTMGRFMLWFGPVSSLFDLLTFAFLFFIFCPAICQGEYSTLGDPQSRAYFAALFQTGWFLESMWTQLLILLTLRSRHPIWKAPASFPVLLVTICGSVLYTFLTFTSAGALIGLTIMPFSYFGFLMIIVCGYLLTISFVKKRYIRRYGRLI